MIDCEKLIPLLCWSQAGIITEPHRRPGSEDLDDRLLKSRAPGWERTLFHEGSTDIVLRAESY